MSSLEKGVKGLKKKNKLNKLTKSTSSFSSCIWENVVRINACISLNKNEILIFFLRKKKVSSVVFQWLRICLAMQKMWVQFLVRELRSHN